MDRETLSALAERCEQAEGAAYALDHEISVAIGRPANWQGFQVPNYTSSIDAAITLVPEEWTAWEVRSHGRKTSFSVDLSRLTECDATREDWSHSRAVTPALAICAAALRALAGEG